MSKSKKDKKKSKETELKSKNFDEKISDESETDKSSLNKSDIDTSDTENSVTSEKINNDDKCVYKFITKSNATNSEPDIDEYYDDDDKIFENIKLKEDRITLPILTKYERVRILADRTRHLSQGAKPMIKNAELLSSYEIAKQELEHKVIPFIIERCLPNGIREQWSLSELEIVN